MVFVLSHKHPEARNETIHTPTLSEVTHLPLPALMLPQTPVLLLHRWGSLSHVFTGGRCLARLGIPTALARMNLIWELPLLGTLTDQRRWGALVCNFRGAASTQCSTADTSFTVLTAYSKKPSSWNTAEMAASTGLSIYCICLLL